MSAESLLLPVLATEVAGLVLLVAAIWGHALWTWALDRWSAPRLRAAREELVRTLERVDGGPGRLQALEALPPALQHRLVLGLAPSLQGDRRSRLHRVARESGVAERAERLARSRWWSRRLYGARLLTASGSDAEVVRSLVRDPVPLIRAQAAEWVGVQGEVSMVEDLIDMLDDPAAICRFAAQDALLRMGGGAVEPLAAHLDTRSGRAAVAALEVAVGLADPALLPVALRLCAAPDAPARALAVRLVGALGGSGGIEVALGLTSDPSPDVRAAAAEALGRLGHWPAAPRLAGLLGDPSWDVRRAAGLTLDDLGPPGELVLRRALSSDDPFVADMARLVLDTRPPARPGRS